MLHIRHLVGLASLALMGCQTVEVTVQNQAPLATITAPVDGLEVEPGVLVELVGQMSDDQPVEDLAIRWSSSIDGTLEEGAQTDLSGVHTLAVADLSEGDHVITLSAVDAGGLASDASVTVSVVAPPPDTAPTAELLAPEAGSSFYEGDLITFLGSVGDAEQDPSTLDAQLISSRDGVLWSGLPGAGGTIELSLSTLSEGDHTITLAVADEVGNEADDSLGLSILPVGTAPTVVILGPAAGETFLANETLTVVGTATDPDQAFETLELALVSSRGGDLWAGNPATNGSFSVDLTDLEAGLHTLTMTARDELGLLGEGSVEIEILADGRPTAEITSPAPGSVFTVDEELLFTGLVSDAETDTELLAVSWSSDLDGPLASGAPDSTGDTAVATFLSAGVHLVTLEVVDESGLNGSDDLVVEIIDPSSTDDDGDGQAEIDGDCDDGDPTVYSGAPELCDGLDNDCDGALNNGLGDEFEGNDTLETAHDVGEVDEESSPSQATVSLAGINLHHPDDEDWFQWVADDEWYDNVNVDVDFDMPASGDYVLELWSERGGTWSLIDSDSGTGTLSVSFEGDLFEYDEDDFAVRIYAVSWDPSVCSDSIDADISS